MENAIRAHDRGQHSVEGNMLVAGINELGHNAARASTCPPRNRFIAFARDLIQRGT